jgi:anthranilate synthase component II
MRTLIIDNYDSFTFNLFQLLGELGANPIVKKNDELRIESIRKINPSHIVISPGPGIPSDSKYFGISLKVIREFTDTPILGVCLGHQGICYAFGGQVVRAPVVMHGKTSLVKHDSKGLFQGIASPLRGMRYHSLIVEKKSLPMELRITAKEEKSGIVMAVQHVMRPLFGIQFHPESVGTLEGRKILGNFLGFTMTYSNPNLLAPHNQASPY